VPRTPPTSNAAVSLALVALAAMLWGLSGGLAGFLMERGWDPLLLSLHRSAFGFVVIAVWLIAVRRKPFRPSPALVGWAVLAGLGVAGNFGFYALGIQTVGVAVAVTLMYAAPAFVFAVSIALGMERATWDKAVAVVGVLAGLALLTEIHTAGLGAVSTWGMAFGLLAGLSYAVFLFAFKAAARTGSAMQAIAIALATATVALLPWVEGEALGASLVSADLPWLVLLGVFGAGLSFIAYIIGLRGTVPTVAAVLALVEPVTASLFGVLVLGETLSPVQVAGMAVILVGVGAVGARGGR